MVLSKSLQLVTLPFDKSGKWSTPKWTSPIRDNFKKVFKRNMVKKREIHYKDLRNYSKIALLNSMVGFNPL